MLLNTFDWILVALYFLISLIIGLAVTRRAGKSVSEFFLSGRNMPWWLLGVSMVATTFSADTPNLVTDIVRQNGVAGNWLWWAFLLTGMLTVFVYAKLWRRSKVMTDLEFYELRYNGKAAAFLRGFRAIYLGVFFNIMIMATVSLAMIKICGVMLKLSPLQTILIASIITAIYSALGGLLGVLITDFFQFFIAMIGSISAAVIALRLPDIGGLTTLISHPNVVSKISLLPDFSNYDALLAIFILPLLVQWWSVWYPGAEPGGGGYIAQRMLSAKNEKHAIGATFFFNAAHYALRPWPWIIVALCSLIVFPDLASLQKAFPQIDPKVIKNDLAYPAMLTFLPNGLLGLVVASLFAAYMSTIATHLNWGASYVVNDFYKRFMNPQAEEKKLVRVARISTLVLMILAGIFALVLQNALQAFHIILQIGAGTGLLFLLRWYWWRINAFSEITAMIVSFIIALYFQFVHPMTGLPPISAPLQLILGVAITTISWILVTLVTRPTDTATLRNFYRLTRPGGPGWKKVIREADEENDWIEASDVKWDVPFGILLMILGCLAIYGTLFATGYWIYGKYLPATILTIVAGITSFLLIKLWNRVKTFE
ncbi:Na+:solute symporter [candidate division KSB1 bacterium]|nr:Na+:solute symporter [candidate division KSB1 bacterium]